MTQVHYVDRLTHQINEELIPCKSGLEFLYGKSFLGRIGCHILSKWNFASRLYGLLQKSSMSRKWIAPFVKAYGIDQTEFLDPIDTFSSFNDFFIRKLKKGARPIAPGKERAILPADGRYLAFPYLPDIENFWIKGKKFSIQTLLKDPALASRYREGSMVIARLAPVDYHRFHFPADCTPSQTLLINGHLYSVNPIALRKMGSILGENKRTITSLETDLFGTILSIEVGATNVGSIQQTFDKGCQYGKGDEKGFFSFGGSCLILLFEPGKIVLDLDLVEATKQGIEVLGKMGQSMGQASSFL